MLPPLADQVTAVFELPLTLAVNCWVPPAESDAVPGVTDTETGALTFTVAEADLVVSVTLVAVTV